jgi:ABC-2 type transport system ATP-binding protein
MEGAGGSVTLDNTGALVVSDLDAPTIGELAAAGGIVLHELSPRRASLEDVFMELTQDSIEFHAAGEVRR